MASYRMRHYRSQFPGMKSGPVIADASIEAAEDQEAIAVVTSKWMAQFNPDTDTIYIWRGNALVWQEGLGG